MVHANKSKRIIFYNDKTLTPLPSSPDPEEWISSTSGYLKWKYNDLDEQAKVTIQVTDDLDSLSLLFTEEFVTSNKFVALSQIDTLPSSGLFYWRIKALGTQASTYSDFSDWFPLKIDSVTPTIIDTSIVSIYSGMEFHQNLQERTDSLGIDDGVFISNDSFTNRLSIDISHPFNPVLKDGDVLIRDEDRTYFFDVYFPGLTSTEEIDYIADSGFSVKTGITDVFLTSDTNKTGILDFELHSSVEIGNTNTYNGFFHELDRLSGQFATDANNIDNSSVTLSYWLDWFLDPLPFAKISFSLYVPISSLEGDSRESFKITLPHLGSVIVRGCYFKGNYFNYIRGLSSRTFYGKTGNSVSVSYANLPSSAVTLDDIKYQTSLQDPRIDIGILSIEPLVKIGKLGVPPQTYVQDDRYYDSTDGLVISSLSSGKFGRKQALPATTPAYDENGRAAYYRIVETFTSIRIGLRKNSFALGLNGNRPLELISNSYYYANSDARNSVGEPGTTNLSLVTHYEDYDNFRVGDKFAFLNSYYTFQNAPIQVYQDTGSVRNFKRSFEIVDKDSDALEITLGENFDSRYVAYRFPRSGIEGVDYYSIPISSLSSSTDEHGNIRTTLSDTVNSVLFSQILSSYGGIANDSRDFLISESDRSTQIVNDHGLANRFVGIKMSDDSTYREYPIIDNNNNTITILGDVLEDLVYTEDTDEFDYYISGDTFSIYNDSLFIENPSIKVFVESSNNISGIKGIKVIETSPSDNTYQYLTDLETPSITNIKSFKSDGGALTGPIKYTYNISAIDSTGKESYYSSDAVKTLLDADNRFITISWDASTNAVGYRVYGRGNNISDRTLLSIIPNDHTTPEGENSSISYNDFGNIEQGDITVDGGLGVPSSLSVTPTANYGVLKKNITYYYKIVSFIRNEFNDIEESDDASVSSVSTTLDNYRNAITWSDVAEATGYRIYRKNDDDVYLLIATIYDHTNNAYTDAGPDPLIKTVTTSNLQYTRNPPNESTVNDSARRFIDSNYSLTTNNRYGYLSEGMDLASVSYTISNTDSEVVDLYISVINNADVKSSSSHLSMGTNSVSRDISTTNIYYDFSEPYGSISLIDSTLNSSSEDVIIDFNNIKSKSMDVESIQFSNFNSESAFSPSEVSYTGFKYWKMGYEYRFIVGFDSASYDGGTFYDNRYESQNLLFRKDTEYGINTYNSKDFIYAEIPITLDSPSRNTPISRSYLPLDKPLDVMNKTIKIGPLGSVGDTATCVEILEPGTNIFDKTFSTIFTDQEVAKNYYRMLVRITKEIGEDEILPYIKSAFRFGTLITLNVLDLSSGSFDTGGLNLLLVNTDYTSTNGLEQPYSIQSDFNYIDFAETNASSLSAATKLGQINISRYDFDDVGQVISVSGGNDLYIGTMDWFGYFFANIEAVYRFYGTVRGKHALSVTNTLEGNTPLFDTFESPEEYVTSVGEIKLKRGWYPIEYVARYNSNAAPLSDLTKRAVALEYEIRINENHFPVYPQINQVDTTTNSITFTQSSDSLPVKDHALTGGYCFFGLLDPSTGSAVAASDKSRSDFENVIEHSGTNRSILFNDKVHTRVVPYNVNALFDLSRSSSIDDTTHVVHYDFIQPNVNEFEFTIVSDVIAHSGSKKAILLPTAIDRIPRFEYVQKPDVSNTTKYRLFKWLMPISDNYDDVIEFPDVLEGTWTAVSQEDDDGYGKYTLFSSEEIGFADTLQYYGMPLIVDVEEVSPTVRQVLEVTTAKQIRVAGWFDDPDSLVGASFRLGDINDIISSDDRFYVNYGKQKTVIESDNLSKNATTIFSNIKDKYNNSEIFPMTISLRGLVPTSNLSNAVVEYYVDGPKKGQFTFTNIGEQVYDAQLIDKSVGIYESEVLNGGSGFEFWRSISWDADILDDLDVKVEVRTGITEEECLNATYNKDAFGITYPAYTILSWDAPQESPTGVNLLHFTSDGSVDDTNELIKKKFLQFRITLTTTSTSYTPKLNSVTVKYSTGNATLLMSKNFTLTSNIVRGIITANTDIPDGTSILWGVSTDDDTDFSKFQRIYLDEVFEIPENSRDKQFKIAAQLIASNEDIPRIFDIAMQFECESGTHLLNI